MNIFFTLIFNIFLLFCCSFSYGQWVSTFYKTPRLGNLPPREFSEITVTADGGILDGIKAVDGTNNYQAFIVSGWDYEGQADSIAKAFANIPFVNLLKAKAGKPVTLEFEFKMVREYQYSFPYYISGYGEGRTNIVGDQGKNEQVNTFDKEVIMEGWPTEDFYDGSLQQWYTIQPFRGTYTFEVGRTQSYLVFPFARKTNVGSSSRQEYTIIVPFVVEGPTEIEVDSLGVTTEPQIPYMIVHSPPGDNSTATVTNSGTKCRSFEEKVSLNESNEFYGAYKLGFKGSVGFILNLELEVYAEVSASGTQGSFQTKRKSTENCVTVSNSLTAISNGKGAQKNDLFVGYGIDLAYGFAKNLKIVNNDIVIDTSLIYRPLLETKREFFLTKTGILNDIAIQQAKVNDSLNYTIPQRANAQYQINVWRQVLDKNDANIAAAALLPGENMTFNGGGSQNYFSSIAYNTAQSIEVEHYIDTQIGVEVAAYFGGSGFKAGAKFTTNKTFGQIQSSTGGQSQDITVLRFDDDDNDYFTVKAVKDPVYGTPIFILDSALSKTSGPYEGGYPLDQPSLEIVGTSDLDTTISNISLGTSGNFRVKACNNSKEPRNYDFGFVGESIATDLILTSAASEGTQVPNTSITKFKTITAVPIGGCKTETFDINASRRNAGSEMNYSNIEFQLYAEQDPDRKSSVKANLSWAGPPPPTGVSASPTELCTTTPVTLVADCPPTTTARWYTTAIGGFSFDEGESVTITPTANVIYYIGCETPNYARDRVATKPVLFANNAPTLSLNTDFNTNSLQIANTTLTATSKIIDPARVTYKAGNSLVFNPGFEALNGSTFTAEIGGCGNFSIPGLVAYYSFSGNANDESGNNHNGIINGATLTTDKFGAAQKALSFDGNNDFVRIPNLYNATTQPLNNVTYSLWFKPSQNYGITDFYSLIIRTTDGGFTDMIGKPSFGSAENDKFQFFMFDNNLNFTKATTNNFAANQWYHVVATRANGTTKIYLNATKEGEATYANSPYFYPDLYLGGHQTANRWYFNGALDDLRIYNRALSDTEVQSIYNAEKL